MFKLADMLLPMLTVEFCDADFLDRTRIKATNVDAVAIRVGTWNIKRFNAADIAEQMLGDARVERISR